MSREIISCAILFADIANSTRLYEVLGDKVAKAFFSLCVSQLKEVTKEQNGEVIKTIGDAVMCTFKNADDAVTAAHIMHKRVDDLANDNVSRFDSPNLYIGVNYGRVIRENDDIFGDAVNLAAKIIKFAKQRHTIITEHVVNALKPNNRQTVQYIKKVRIKGKVDRIKIYEAVWEELEMTVIIDDSTGSQELMTFMEIRCNKQIIIVDQFQPFVSFGRQNHNDLVTSGFRVSRSHGYIEFRRGKFILTDHSSNGTYVMKPNQEPIHLKRDEMQLVDSGIIGLGQKVDSESEQAIHFKSDLRNLGNPYKK